MAKFLKVPITYFYETSGNSFEEQADKEALVDMIDALPKGNVRISLLALISALCEE